MEMSNIDGPLYICKTDQKPLKAILSDADFRKENSSSIDKFTINLNLMGSNTNILKKKNYFKKILRRSRKAKKSIMREKILNILSKFILVIISNLLNFASVVIYILQTYYEALGIEQYNEVESKLDIWEVSLSYYFLIEFILLLAFSNEKLKHLFSFESLIDAITVIPNIIRFYAKSVDLRLSFIRVFRIFRVFRILRVYKSLLLVHHEFNSKDDNESLSDNISVNIDPIKMQISSIFIILICIFFIGAGLVLGIQELVPGSFSNNFKMNFFDALYFMIVTGSSIGFGDIYPTHIISRIFIVVWLIMIIIIVIKQVSKIYFLLNHWGVNINRYEGRDHIIVICDKSINIKYFLLGIKKSNYKQEIVIVSNDIKILPSKEFPYNRVFLSFTNTIDNEALSAVNANSSKAIVVFTPKSYCNLSMNEKIINFLILKIKIYFPNVPLYIQTLYSEHTYNSNLNVTMDEILTRHEGIVPVFKIKTFITCKNIINPGFSCFIQNLTLNDYSSDIKFTDYSCIFSRLFIRM